MPNSEATLYSPVAEWINGPAYLYHGVALSTTEISYTKPGKHIKDLKSRLPSER